MARKKARFRSSNRHARQYDFSATCSGNQLERNFFGIWEPVSEPFVSPRTIDLVIAPVVVFDNRHYRIGMGGGYCDRCFSFLQHRRNWLHQKLIGVAFDCREVEKITPSPWDMRLCQVITENAWPAPRFWSGRKPKQATLSTHFSNGFFTL